MKICCDIEIRFDENVSDEKKRSIDFTLTWQETVEKLANFFLNKQENQEEVSKK